MAPLLLGYEWSSNVSHHGNSKEEASYLSVFITLDPPITSKEEPSVTEINQRPFWVFPTNESDDNLMLAHQFEKACRAVGERVRFVCTVVNSDRQLVLATRFFRPLPPPPEILKRDGDDHHKDKSQLTFLTP
ncbi:protein CC2D2B-like [Clupea harengus]|uniref:Protein CC2D2B-like n=1 Tax=Clupea harengus TaxID=7950 RepID=A0A6P8GG44_CLUHA|nr:protein CC2D2B-like [Clupea harengus]